MSKLSKDKQQKLLLVGVITAAVLAAIYLLIISAQRTTLSDYGTKLDAAREKLAKAENWARMAPSIDSKLDAARQELEAKHECMAPADKFKWFYNTMEKPLASARIKLTDITKEPELGEVGVLPKFPYRAAIFGVKLNTPFHQFGSFLADFENQFPYMRVQNLEVEPDLGGRGGAKDAGTIHPAEDPESLSITLRVVTLVKPTTPL